MSPISILHWIVLFLVVVTRVRSDDALDDTKRNVSQLITSKGYPLEEYEVTTPDGYILSMQRIPHGRNNENNGKVVYLQHGVLGASSDFCLNPENTSLTFFLSNAGFDVWLGNVRGNTYSRKHIKYTDKDPKFWEFTMDQMAKYDVPTMIDFILNTTGQEKLYYIGHSQGTTILFAMLAERPEYNDKLKVAIALAPVAFEGHMRGMLQFMGKFSKVMQVVMHWFGQDEFMPSKSIISTAAEMFCGSNLKMLCQNVAFLVGGTDSEQMDTARLPVYMSHFPGGTSTINMVHHTQLQSSGKFQKYDFGWFGNKDKYGQWSPPEYPLEKITAPIALLWGQNDNLGDPEDVSILKSKLKSVIRYFKVKFEKWNHFDFVLGKDAPKYIYGEIMDILDQY